jgi:hypothetical protein
MDARLRGHDAIVDRTGATSFTVPTIGFSCKFLVKEEHKKRLGLSTKPFSFLIQRQA